MNVKLSKFSSTNKSFGAACDRDGRVYTWGANQQGQLGTGDTKDKEQPVYLQALKRKRISNLAVG